MAGPSKPHLQFVIPEGVKFAGIRTPQEQQQFLSEALSVFEGTGVKWEEMTVKECEKLGYTVDQFAKAIRNIDQFKDVDSMEQAWVAAMQGGEITLPHRAKLVDILRFSQWLKSSDGMKAMKAFAVEARLRRRATDTMDPSMIAKCDMLDQMRGAYSSKVKAARTEFDEEIQKYVREIARLKKLTEDNVKAIADESPQKKKKLVSFERIWMSYRQTRYELQESQIRSRNCVE